MRTLSCSFIATLFICLPIRLWGQTPAYPELHIPQQTLDSLQQALKKAYADTTRSRILNELSIAYRNLDIIRAATFAQQALQKAEATRYYPMMAESLFSLAYCYDVQGLTDKAIHTYQQAGVLFQKVNKTQRYAVCMNNIGVMYYKKKDYVRTLFYERQALAIYQKLFSEKKQMTPKDSSHLASSYNNIGYAYSLLEKPDTAMYYLWPALELAQKAPTPDKMSSTLNNLGICFFQKKNFSQALSYSHQSLAFAEKGRLHGRIQEATTTLAQIYAAMGQYALAYKYRTLESVAKDSLKVAAQTTAMYEIATRYEVEKKEQAIGFLKQLQQFQLSIFIGGISFTCIVIALLYYRKNAIKRLNTTLQLQKNEITEQKEQLEQQNTAIIAAKKDLLEAYEEVHAINQHQEQIIIDRTRAIELKNQRLLEYAYLNAHRLRSPVSQILGLISVIEMEHEETQKEHLFELLKQASQNLNTLTMEISQLLNEQAEEEQPKQTPINPATPTDSDTL